MLWLSCNLYISSCCTKETSGLYFGILWVFMGISSIISSLIVLLVLPYLSLIYFFIILILVTMVAFVLLCFLSMEPLENKNNLEDSSKSLIMEFSDSTVDNIT